MSAAARKKAVDGALDAAFKGEVAYVKRYKRTAGSRRHGKKLMVALAKAMNEAAEGKSDR